MKQIFTLVTLAISSLMIGQTPCSGGSASGFPCNNFDLLSRITLGEMNANGGNDSWGWTDPSTGREYALMGLDNGTGFIDITDPVNPVYLGKLPTFTDPSTWRDIKVYNDHAFIVSEAFGHGMQVFDLTRLRNVTNPPQTFNEDAHYNGFGSAHNIVINEDTGFAYAVGTGTFNGGPHFINIQDPTNPTAAGGYALDDYSHDAQVVTYNGPDAAYAGREILVGSNENAVVVVDITDKNNPTPISSTGYSNVGYTHQGWFTEDQRYFIVGDELDEFSVGFNTRTLVFDFEDLDSPFLDFEYFGPTPAVDHNGYTKGDMYFMANYSAGMRAIDLSDIANGNITEYGFFDTVPGNDDANFGGAWSVYPYFPSGNVIISGATGFTVVRDVNLSTESFAATEIQMYPNPASTELNFKSSISPITQIEIFNVLGQRVLNFDFAETNNMQVNISTLKSGVYIVQINQSTTKRLVVK